MATNLVPDMFSRRAEAMRAHLDSAGLTRGVQSDFPCEVLVGEWYDAPTTAKVFVHRVGGPVHYGMGNQSGEAYIHWQIVSDISVPGDQSLQETIAGTFAANILAALASMAQRNGLVYGWKSLRILPGGGVLTYNESGGQLRTIEVFLLEMMFGVAMPATITLPADVREPAG